MNRQTQSSPTGLSLSLDVKLSVVCDSPTKVQSFAGTRTLRCTNPFFCNLFWWTVKSFRCWEVWDKLILVRCTLAASSSTICLLLFGDHFSAICIAVSLRHDTPLHFLWLSSMVWSFRSSRWFYISIEKGSVKLPQKAETLSLNVCLNSCEAVLLTFDHFVRK